MVGGCDRPLESRRLSQLRYRTSVRGARGIGSKGSAGVGSRRLRVLLEHILKRCYAHSVYDNRGWESTIETQRQELKELLRQSPSLKQYFTERFEDCYQDALSLVRRNYPGTMFPDEWQFTGDVDAVLTKTFWVAN